MATVTQLRLGKYSLFDVRLPGRKPETAGVILWDEAGEARCLFRRDFHLIANEDELAVVVDLERQLNVYLQEYGIDWFLNRDGQGLSNFLTASDPEQATIDNFDKTLLRLYRKHVPSQIQRYETHLPRVRLAAAAGSWGEAMSPEGLAEQAEEWIEVPEGIRIDDQMFIAQVVGRSMEPEIADGSLCIFRYNPAGSRRNRRVLVENFSDSQQRYTVKRYQSVKEYLDDDSFRHRRITLEPLNPEFEPWELEEGADCRILGEFIAVLPE